jgi:20S proteasome alpha/beta subunit
MLTAGDIEFEPPQTKIYRLTPHIVAAVAGSASAHAILHVQTMARIASSPTISVSEATKIYAEEFAKHRSSRAEREILFPLGLTLDTFVGRQREISQELVSRIAADLRTRRLDVEAIVTGVDSSGAHIYVVCGRGSGGGISPQVAKPSRRA